LHAEPLICPEAMNVQEIVKDVPTGWTPVSEDIRHPLKRVAFFDGNPVEKAELIPTKNMKKEKFLYTIWEFDAAIAKNLWISCSYGQTSQTLARPVNKIYKQCILKHDPEISIDGLPSVVSIECK
jgi:hypothetical protein